MNLPDTERERFERDGFVGPLDVLTPDEVARVRNAVAEVIAELPRLEDRLYEVELAHVERPDEVVCHFLGGWRVHPVLRALVFDPRITRPCATLLGVERLRFFHDQVFAKPPHHPGVVPWHQDFSYWQRTAPARHITLNLLLDDSDAESGCLSFLPGSHRLPLLPPIPFDADLEAIREHVAPEIGWDPVAVPCRAGQATIHHSHLLHGSGSNRSGRWRRAVVLNYMAADVRVADGRAPLLRGVPHLPTGAVVEGPDFPIVWQRG
ncbi:MAG: phytanoyl-CoA dioxygenase family protein [Planctomycetes bacterium]|nr:phytanoyl-CoA dioxygenase family protein [Planctomycetota bacterium]